MTQQPACEVLGRWRIVEGWGTDYVDMLDPGHIQLTHDGGHRAAASARFAAFRSATVPSTIQRRPISNANAPDPQASEWAARDLSFALEADAVLFGSGMRTREIAGDPAMLERLRGLDPRRRLIGAHLAMKLPTSGNRHSGHGCGLLPTAD